MHTKYFEISWPYDFFIFNQNPKSFAKFSLYVRNHYHDYGTAMDHKRINLLTRNKTGASLTNILQR